MTVENGFNSMSIGNGSVFILLLFLAHAFHSCFSSSPRASASGTLPRQKAGMEMNEKTVIATVLVNVTGQLKIMRVRYRSENSD